MADSLQNAFSNASSWRKCFDFWSRESLWIHLKLNWGSNGLVNVRTRNRPVPIPVTIGFNDSHTASPCINMLNRMTAQRFRARKGKVCTLKCNNPDTQTVLRISMYASHVSWNRSRQINICKLNAIKKFKHIWASCRSGFQRYLFIYCETKSQSARYIHPHPPSHTPHTPHIPLTPPYTTNTHTHILRKRFQHVTPFSEHFLLIRRLGAEEILHKTCCNNRSPWQHHFRTAHKFTHLGLVAYICVAPKFDR